VRLLICDLSASPYVDMAGARMLHRLQESLSGRGIPVRIAETRAGVRDMLRAEGLPEKVGLINRFVSVDDVIRDFEQQPPEDSGRRKEP